MTSVEMYIPFDLRERLAEIIKVIDKTREDAVAAERERCARLCEYMAEWNAATRDDERCFGEAALAIRKGE